MLYKEMPPNMSQTRWNLNQKASKHVENLLDRKISDRLYSFIGEAFCDTDETFRPTGAAEDAFGISVGRFLVLANLDSQKTRGETTNAGGGSYTKKCGAT